MVRPATTCQIVPLAAAPDAAPTLARWFVEARPPYYGDDGPGDAAAALAACARTGSLPPAGVALDSAGRTLGTAALKRNSAGDAAFPGPWLAALLVGPGHRQRGIGSALVAAIEVEAVRQGFDAIYVSADEAGAIFERRGWLAVGEAPSLTGPVGVYRFELASSLERC